jgi:hypothetical protein
LDPTEVEQDDLDNDEILLIWDFDVDELLSENAIAITPGTSTDIEEYPQAPLLDINAEFSSLQLFKISKCRQNFDSF